MDEKMVDLKLKENNESKEVAKRSLTSARYPYGLHLNFEQEQIEKITILKDSHVGDRVIIHAEGRIHSKRIAENENNGVTNMLRKRTVDKEYNVGIQLEKIAVIPKTNKKPEEMNPKEYREMRGREI